MKIYDTSDEEGETGNCFLDNLSFSRAFVTIDNANFHWTPITKTSCRTGLSGRRSRCLEGSEKNICFDTKERQTGSVYLPFHPYVW